MRRERRSHPRRIGALLALLLAVGALAGCVRIPLDGTVETVPIEDVADGSDLIVVPEGPVAGASPREILRGFLLAGRGPQNGYAVAREFLTDDFATQWWPGAGVIITSSPIQPVDEGENRLRLTVEASAELDEHGRYLRPEQVRHELEFEFRQENGEWRISRAPNGTVLSPANFDAIFEPVTLHFWSPDFRFLVPEQRWFLATRTIANRVVDELLNASSPLVDAGVLVTAFPEGTSLTESVSISGGHANVTLSSGVLAVDRRTQSRILAQLDQSLASLGEVESTTIVSGGFPVSIDPVPGLDSLLVEPFPVVVRDGRVGLLDAGQVTVLPGLGSALDDLDLRALAIARSGREAAVLLDEGVATVTSAGVELRDRRDGLAAPAIDPWGWVWSVPANDPAGLIATSADGVVRALPLELEGRVVAMRVSRDGTRVLAAIQEGERTTAIVAGIRRDAQLGPVAIVAPTVITAGSRLVDAAWVSGTQLALLSDAGVVMLAEIGGRVLPLGAVPGGVQIVGGNGEDGIRVRDSSGRVWRPGYEAGWLEIGSGVTLLGVQQ